MAPSVNKTYRKSLKSNLEKYNEFTGQKVKAEISDDITLGDDKALKKAKIPESVIKAAKEDTEHQTLQAMEGFVHNLNTMHSRAGAQVPFTSINFGSRRSPRFQDAS